MKPRSIKTLLKLILKCYTTNEFMTRPGLCYCMRQLFDTHRITTWEYQILIKFIISQQPKHTKYHTSQYWWNPDNIIPRIRFLNKLISKL